MVVKGHCLVAQSGGPTTVINSSLAGVIKAALESQHINKIYGGFFGIQGILNDCLKEITLQNGDINNLKYTPGAALGSSRYKLTKDEEYERLLEVIRKYDIHYFYYIGGNDSMDTANKISNLAKKIDYELYVIGVPKTIDNDLPYTDHCPGYGSAAKYLATVVLETGLDLKSLITKNRITILEAMGRNAGWLTAASALAKKDYEDAPHLIYLPEVSFNKQKFVEDVKRIYDDLGYVYIVASEGLKDEKGDYIFSGGVKDSFGHVQLGGLGQTLKDIIEKETNIKARVNILGTSQRSAVHFASRCDIEEAFLVGQEAVNLTSKGKSGVMVTIEREPGLEYRVKLSNVELSKVANIEKKIPLEWINKDKNYVTEEFINYAAPLISGEVIIPIEKGLPSYFEFSNRSHYRKKLIS